ncbi:MAG: hypothetical protein JXR80_06105 [Deltaproteobacteria bacterium]|nr:hypothetical protein [Deltaproteobacteria bacterium]
MNLFKSLQEAKDTVKKQIAKEFLVAAKKGEFLIPQTCIEAGLRHALRNEPGVTVEMVTCHTRGITLTLVINRLGSILTSTLLIKVGELKLSGACQQLMVSIVTQKALGGNLLGKVASGLAGSIIDRLLIDKIRDQEIVSRTTIREQQTDIEIDLSSLAPVQKLARPLPLIGKSPLDLVTIKTVDHVPGGLLLKLEQSFF